MICTVPNSFGVPLLERDGTFSYASTQVQMPPKLARLHQRLAAKIADKHLADHGREDDPHITVKYGLHPAHADKAEAIIRRHPPIAARLGKTSSFTGGEDGDVVKVGVHSPGLHRLHQALKAGVPNTETYPTYDPHMTVAYVKPGQAKQYEGLDDLDGHGAVFKHVMISDKAGNKRKVPLQGSPRR